MRTILFASPGSALRPLLAATHLKAMGLPGMRAAVAAGEVADPLTARIVAELQVEGGENVLPLAGVDLFAYDLVVVFAAASAPLYPPLPGAPAVVYWQLPEPPAAGDDPLSVYRQVEVEVGRLVRDLFQQGYFQALVESKKNAELVLDNLQEGILAHDRYRKIFFFNRAAERITGYSRREIVGRDCHEVFPEKFCKRKCSFCDPTASPVLHETSYPLTLRTKAGISKQLEMSLVAIEDLLSNVVGVVASFRDRSMEYELAGRLGEEEHFSGIIGADLTMREIFQTTRDLANSNVAVLLQGESGTGKELVAAAIHNEGSRAGHRFVPINCGALPENLLESELFGHVKGAFTGAIREKKGRFELADHGTIFLDEIGDISAAMQVKLLRVLQDGTFQKVGSEETLKVDVRVISATHKDLRQEIAAGRFREDLFYRLCVVPLLLPPLRVRRADIPLLARHFLKRALAEEGRTQLLLAPETMAVLVAYDWPGNVRELQNVIRYLMVRCREEVARPHHLPPNLLTACSHAVNIAGPAEKRQGKLSESSVRQAIQAAGGNRLQAARQLGVGRATLYRFLDKHPQVGGADERG